MIKLPYLIAIVPISVLLTISFFVLFAMRKIDEKGLRAFGYVVASLLWLSALVVFSGAVYKMAKGPSMMKCMMQQKMDRISHATPKAGMGAMVMPEKEMMSKDGKAASMPKCGTNKGFIFKSK